MNVTTRAALAGAAGLALAVTASAAMAATPKFPAFAGPPSKDNPVVKPSEIIYSEPPHGFTWTVSYSHGFFNI